MKNLLLNIACLFALILLANAINAQVTTLGNTSIFATDYSGWDAGVTFDFNVRHFGNQNINFGTNGIDRMHVASYGNVGVGTGGGVIRPKFLTVLTNANASATPFENVAIRGHNSFSSMFAAPATHVGIDALCTGASPNEGNWNLGGRFQARFAHSNVGLESFVQDWTLNNNVVGVIGIGVRGWASDHSEGNFALIGRAAPHPSFLGSQVVGVFGGVDGLGTNMWAGWFQGDTFTPLGLWTASDEQFKTNVEDLGDALNIINQLNPKSYNFLTEEFGTMNFPSGQQYGVMAQELGEV